MVRPSLALVLSTIALAACGSTTQPTAAAPSPAEPVVAPVAPVAPPSRFVPANAELRIPAGELRGVVGTDVVLRVDAPQRVADACTVHLVLRAGSDGYDETVACESPVVFHGLTIVVSGEPSMSGRDLVGVRLATDGPDEAPTADCASDADCVLDRFSCCSAPPCDDDAYNRDVLAFMQDRCARRVCPPFEARPCGFPPDGPSMIHARCYAGTTCQAVP